MSVVVKTAFPVVLDPLQVSESAQCVHVNEAVTDGVRVCHGLLLESSLRSFNGQPALTGRGPCMHGERAFALRQRTRGAWCDKRQ